MLHQGVGVGRFVGEVVALQQLAVVFAYHALDVAALQAGVGGQQLSVAGVGHEIGADVAGHGELVVEFEDAGLRLLVLRHIHGGCGAYVGDEVGALVAGDVGVDVAQLVLDDPETVVDEVGGGDGYLVFVVYPVFVIDVYQCLEHVVGALGGLVGNGELDYGAVFSGHGHLQAGVVRVACGGEGVFMYHQLYFGTLGVGGRGGDDDGAAGGGDGAVEASGVFLVGLAVGGDEVLDGDMAGGVYLQGEGEGAFRGVAVDGDTHGKVGAVGHLIVEATVLDVIDIKAEATHHFLHEVLGLEVVDLVLEVGVGLEEAHVGEFVGAYGVAFGFVLDQYLGTAAVDVGCAQQPQVGGTDADGDGEYDPRPVAQGHKEDVKNGYRA